MNILFLVTICLCVFGCIVLLFMVVYRARQIRGESKEVHRRLEFWLSEKSVREKLFGVVVGEDKDESFTKRILIPLGEQVGQWFSEKVPYNKQSQVRKLLVKAGYRDKKALQFFYTGKIIMSIIFAIGTLSLLSMLAKDIKDISSLGLIAGISAFIGFKFFNFYLDKKATERIQKIDRVLPDALDLLVICTEAGMGIDQSLLRVAANLGSKGRELAEEIVLTNREMNLGQDRSVCWNNLGERSGSEELKNLSRVIVQSEKVGASVANVLRSQSNFLRLRRRQKAEETAAKMTIKMMVPMALFIFPCIMAVTMGPPLLKLMGTFGGLGK